MNRLKLTAIVCCLAAVMAYGKSSTWRFAVIGDTHVPAASTIKKIIPELIHDNVEVVVFAGDLIQGGKGQDAAGMYEELTEWKKLTQPLTEAGITILAVRGNHEADVKGDNQKPWKELISPTMNIVLQHKNITFIGIDNYINGERTVDTDWLEKELGKIDKDNIIVPFGHEPAFSCNSFHPQCLDANPAARNRFWDILEKYGVGSYFCGHTHQYNLCRINHNGHTINQIICGGGGGKLQPAKGGIRQADGYDVESVEIRTETGYLLVDVKDHSISTCWKRVYDKDVPTATGQTKKKRPRRPMNRRR